MLKVNISLQEDIRLDNFNTAVNKLRPIAGRVSSAVALAYTMMFAQFCRDSHRVHADMETLRVLCTEQRVANYYLACGTILHGWALSAQGCGEEREVLMRRGLADLRGAGGELRLLYYLALMAEACGQANHVAEGLTLLT